MKSIYTSNLLGIDNKEVPLDDIIVGEGPNKVTLTFRHEDYIVCKGDDCYKCESLAAAFLVMADLIEGDD